VRRTELSLLAALCLAAGSAAADLDLRIKAFASATDLPDGDAQRALDGSPARDESVDLRGIFSTGRAGWHFAADPNVVVEAGDAIAFRQLPQATLDQTPTDDEWRFFDLTTTLDEDRDQRTIARFDRLSIEYRGAGWSVAAGRRAVSWGSGIVFQPLDLFAPFAPTTVDRDYKPGEDVVLFDRLFAGGSDLELLGVFRRDESGDRDVDSDSFGAKWHGYFGGRDVEIVAGRHYRDRIAGASVRQSLGGALLRGDVLLTDGDGSGTYVSGIVNLDYTLTVRDRNVYLFAELFHNGFGMGESAVDLARVPARLRARLARGEVFNLLRDYGAVGAQVEWHPLVTQSLTYLANFQDGSGLVQTELRYEPGDATRLDIGLIERRGHRDEEFGAIELPVPGTYTTGGGTSVYARFVWYR
jgi:hypothetical protein